MTRPRHQVAIVLLALIAVGACTESNRPVATGKGSVRGIHAVVDAPDLNFLIEEKSIGSVAYRQAVGFVDYDDLAYNFNFDTGAFGDKPARRLATEFIDFAADTEYSVALTGTLNNPSIVMWEAPERDFDATETVFEMDFVHLSPKTGQVDVYFAEEGTAPILGNEVGTLELGQRIPYREFAGGTYEVIVTAPDDPATVLFQSFPIPASAASRVTLAIFDVDGTITAPLAVSLINRNGAATTLADINHPSQVRLFHTASAIANADAYYDSDFDNLVFGDVGFGELTAYSDIASNTTTLNLTAVGDSTAPIYEGEIGVLPNSRATVVFGGAADSPGYKVLRDNARPLASYPVARIMYSAVNVDRIDVYILEPGTPIDDTVVPTIVNATSAYDTGFLPLLPGMRELTVTANGEKTPLATPLVIDTAAGDIFDIIILDTADPAVLDMQIFDSNQP